MNSLANSTNVYTLFFFSTNKCISLSLGLSLYYWRLSTNLKTGGLCIYLDQCWTDVMLFYSKHLAAVLSKVQLFTQRSAQLDLEQK